MKAMVRFATGETSLRTITNIENDGSGDYGYVRYHGKKVPVSQSTTFRRSDGTIVEKRWDEIVGAPVKATAEEEW